MLKSVPSGVDMISDRGRDQKKTKWEKEIGKSPTLSKLFTQVVQCLTISNNEYDLN